MSNHGDSFGKTNDFNAVKISLFDPKKIREESKGEVKKPETVNYRSYKPERDGLFCERIFGPEKDWECSCGKYRGMKYKGMTCDRCGVKITHSRVRRKRMGHIELSAPVVHIWFFRASSSRLATLLAMKTSSLEKVVYFQEYVVTDAGETDLKVGQLLTEEEYRKNREEYGPDAFKAEMGAEAIRKLLRKLDVVELSKQLREELSNTRSKQKKKELIGRLRLVETLRNCKHENKAEWMVLETIPVIPPDLRQLERLDSDLIWTSDLNDLYRRVINRNNRLEKLIGLNAPDVVIRNEKRMLQQSVDVLFDNMRFKRPVMGSSNRPLKSLTDMIKGKQGRFGDNLLSKRVDYSARGVVVVDSNLQIHQCGLPKSIALELYQPFIIRKLKERNLADTIKSAKKIFERGDIEIWKILEEIVQNHPVLLNRAPTLHSTGIQAFEPILVEGNAIKLHPLVCKGFDVNFDGDQMTVHLPLSSEAQVEAHTLLLSTNNVLSPSDGSVLLEPRHDIVLGLSFLTLEKKGVKGEGALFSSFNECLLALDLRKVSPHARIRVRFPKDRYLDGFSTLSSGKIVETTPGRVLFNQLLKWGPYYNFRQTHDSIIRIIRDSYERQGREETLIFVDRLMKLGFEQATLSGISLSVSDLKDVSPKNFTKEECRSVHENGVCHDVFRGPRRFYESSSSTSGFNRQFYGETDISSIDNFDRRSAFKREELREGRKSQLCEEIDPLSLIITSGSYKHAEDFSRLFKSGNLSDNEVSVVPFLSRFTEGLSVSEYADLTSKRLKEICKIAQPIKESRQFTNTLLNATQSFVVTMYDCGTRCGIEKRVFRNDGETIPLSRSIAGRIVCEDVVDLLGSGEPIICAGELITPEIAKKIDECGIEKIRIRSPLTCEAELGVCALCYGADLSTSRLVEEGAAVGVNAALSVGEAGTKLASDAHTFNQTAFYSFRVHEIRAKSQGVVRIQRIAFDDARRLEASVCASQIWSQRCSNGVDNIEVVLQYFDRAAETFFLTDDFEILVSDGEYVSNGQIIARTYSNQGANSAFDDFVSIYDFLDAKRLKEHAIGAKTSGIVKIMPRKFRGKRIVKIKEPSLFFFDFPERVHKIPLTRPIIVSNGEWVKAGQALTDGRMGPIDFFNYYGEELFQIYAVREIQSVFRRHGLFPDDKHLEIILAQMLRKVKIEYGGDADLLAGDVVDKFEFHRRNRELRGCVKVTFSGDTDLQLGDVVPREVFEATNERFEAAGGAPARGGEPVPASGKPQLLGITEAAIQGDSFLAAASFREQPEEALIEAALAYKVDRLVGLKENVMLGRLIPAGTGFKAYRDARWDHRHGGWMIDETFDLPDYDPQETRR